MIMKQKQCMLLRKIKQNGIGTNDVECTLKKLPLSANALGKLRLKIMNAKIKDAYKVKQAKSIESMAQIQKAYTRPCTTRTYAYLENVCWQIQADR